MIRAKNSCMQLLKILRVDRIQWDFEIKEVMSRSKVDNDQRLIELWYRKMYITDKETESGDELVDRIKQHDDCD